MKKSTFNTIIPLGVILTLLLAVFGTAHPAHAQGIIIGDSVESGEEIEHNVILTGDTVSLDGKVIGDVLVIGRNFEFTGEVDGTLVVLATESTINGSVGKNLLNAAISVILEPDATIGWDFYLLSGDVKTNPGSTIGRDLIAYTLGAQLQGEVGRNTQGFIGLGPLVSILWDQIKQIELPQMEFPYNRPTPIVFAGLNFGPSQGLTHTLSILEAGPQQASSIQWDVVGDWFLGRLRALVVFLVLGLIFMLLFPKFLEESAEMIWQKPLQSTGMGIVVLVFVFASFFLLLGMLIPLMLFFSKITLDGLAVITGFVGYSSLILAMTLFVIYGLFITKITAGYLIGKRLLTRFTPGVVRYRILSLLIGGVLLVLVGAIPFLSVLIGVWLSLVGIGAAWYVWRFRRENRFITGDNAKSLDDDRAIEVEQALDTDFEPETAEEMNPDLETPTETMIEQTGDDSNLEVMDEHLAESMLDLETEPGSEKDENSEVEKEGQPGEDA